MRGDQKIYIVLSRLGNRKEFSPMLSKTIRIGTEKIITMLPDDISALIAATVRVFLN